jgi:hypothetical protein
MIPVRLPIALADPAPLLRVDGVPHALGEIAVLEASRRAAFPGTLRWSIELTGLRTRLITRIVGTGSAIPSAGVAAQLLDALRPLLLRAQGARPRFVICTIDRVRCDSSRARLAGTCAPLIPSATDSIARPV